MRKLLLALTLLVAVVAAAACSSGGGGGLSAGNYTASNYRPGTDTCGLNQDFTVPPNNTFDAFPLANNQFTVGGLFLVSSAGGFSSSSTNPVHFQPITFLGGGGIFCSLTQSFSSRIQPTGTD